MVAFFEASYNDGSAVLLGFLDRFGLFRKIGYSVLYQQIVPLNEFFDVARMYAVAVEIGQYALEPCK